MDVDDCEIILVVYEMEFDLLIFKNFMFYLYLIRIVDLLY